MNLSELSVFMSRVFLPCRWKTPHILICMTKCSSIQIRRLEAARYVKIFPADENRTLGPIKHGPDQKLNGSQSDFLHNNMWNLIIYLEIWQQKAAEYFR